MKSSLDSEETGPNRNSADFRIKKAQVKLCPIYIMPVVSGKWSENFWITIDQYGIEYNVW